MIYGWRFTGQRNVEKGRNKSIIFAIEMVIKNKRQKSYESKLSLNEGVSWNDLIKIALEKPDKKQVTKAKRAAGKKK